MKIREATTEFYNRLTSRPLTASALAVTLVTGGLAAGIIIERRNEHPGSAVGTVECASGVAVEGVWVEAALPDQSGWATWRALGRASVASFERPLPEGGDYSVHVGCGGDPANWQSSSASPYVSSEGTLPVTVVCQDAAGVFTGACRQV